MRDRPYPIQIIVGTLFGLIYGGAIGGPIGIIVGGIAGCYLGHLLVEKVTDDMKERFIRDRENERRRIKEAWIRRLKEMKDDER